MALEQLTLETGLNKVEVAIGLLQAWEPPGGYYFADSGGACSSATMDILGIAGVKYDAHYCVSPMDPPQIYAFLREHHPNTQWDIHARNFWQMVVEKGLPMRHRRWCCEYIKEAGGDGRVVVLGNRRDEGANRSHQCFVETPEHRAEYRRKKGLRPRKSNKTFIRPIIDFTTSDLWQYIRENKVKYNPLYDEGAARPGWGEGKFKRLGCVLCPFSRNVALEEEYFPKIVATWQRACGRIVEETKARGYLNKKGQPVKYRFETDKELYDWWVSRK